MLYIKEKCFIDPFSENSSLSKSNGKAATEKLVSNTFKHLIFLSLAQHVWTHLLRNDVLKNLKIFSILLEKLILKHFLS